MAKLLIVLIFFCLKSEAKVTKIDFWRTQKKGANLFNSVEKMERLKIAKNFGVQFIRLAPNKWLNRRPVNELGDFLMGKSFDSLNKSDLKLLKKILDAANLVGLKVVLTMLSLPHARWKQHNNNKEERLIWEDFKYQEGAILFWQQLASELKNHPAVVGYNLRNEPSPELAGVKLDDWYSGDYGQWYEKVKGTPADLNLFYRKIVKAIRKMDQETPIIVDSGYFANAWAFKILEPLPDKKVLYSFHMYEPYAYNSQYNKGRYKYPGTAPIGELGDLAPTINWNKEALEKYLEPIVAWQKKYNIPRNRILVGEVGVFRQNYGAIRYLRDLTSILNQKKWHWAFYSFREDTWHGMDYELGTKKAPAGYWKAIEEGKLPKYKPNNLSRVLQMAIKVK